MASEIPGYQQQSAPRRKIFPPPPRSRILVLWRILVSQTTWQRITVENCDDLFQPQRHGPVNKVSKWSKHNMAWDSHCKALRRTSMLKFWAPLYHVEKSIAWSRLEDRLWYPSISKLVTPEGIPAPRSIAPSTMRIWIKPNADVRASVLFVVWAGASTGSLISTLFVQFKGFREYLKRIQRETRNYYMLWEARRVW